MTAPLKKILYAEDDEDIMSIVKLIFENMSDLEVQYCTDGKKVLQALTHFSPDLILLDVMMPEMDGPSTLIELRKLEKTKNVPVVFMTAKVQVAEIADWNKLGVTQIISKPFDPLTLISQIHCSWDNLQYHE